MSDLRRRGPGLRRPRRGLAHRASCGHLDRLAEATGLGRHARLLYLFLRPTTGEVRYTNAGGCPPLLLDPRLAQGRYVDSATGPPIGAGADVDRSENTLRLTVDSTMLLVTDGLVQSALDLLGQPGWSGYGRGRGGTARAG